MKITVYRKITESNELVFTIMCSQPRDVPFTEIDSSTIKFLELCQQSVEKLANPEHKLVGEVVNSIHAIKERTFSRVKNSLNFSIKNTLEEKIHPICQEIYNWIYDSQKPALKDWMQQFDPERTKYYFDNDRTIESDEDDDD